MKEEGERVLPELEGGEEEGKTWLERLDRAFEIDDEEHLRYTLVNHAAREKLGLTILEYCILDSIYHLAANPKNDGWCRQSRKHISEHNGISIRLVNATITKHVVPGGLLERPANRKNHYDSRLRTTQRWYNTAIARLKAGYEDGAKNAPSQQRKRKMVQKMHNDGAFSAQDGAFSAQDGAETAPYNNSSNSIKTNNNNTAVAVDDSFPKKEEEKIPESLYRQYGKEAVAEALRNVPPGVSNPIGWAITALKRGYGKDPKVPRGAIPDERVSKVNGPGVHWDEGNNTRVMLGSRMYQEQSIEGKIWYVPEDMLEVKGI